MRLPTKFKRLFRATTAIACGLVALAAPAWLTAAETPPRALTEFHATMLEANEAANPAYSGAAGFARFQFHPDSNHLDYEIRIIGIVSATASHIHLGNVGVSGPIIINLHKPGVPITPAAPLTGTVLLNASQVDNLYRGRYYVNVHTPQLPAGHMRGQIWPREAMRTFAAQLAGVFETPPVASSGSGLALVHVNDKGDRMFWNFGVTGVTTPTAAHIHEAPFGASGGVVFDLLGSNPITSGVSITGSAPISASHFAQLLEGRFYVNVHSEDVSSGEVRGQLRPLFSVVEATIAGENEVPPVASTGSGRATFEINNATGETSFSLSVTGIPSATAAHVHSGTTGNNGGVLINLLALAQDNNAAGSDHNHPLGAASGNAAILDPDHHIHGSTQITNPVIRERMYDGSLYVNVHTVANPGGELRGQVNAPARFLTYRAALSGLNENPPVTTTASGAAVFTLDTRTNELTYKVETQGITVTQMHIHTGTLGNNGGVAFALSTTGTLTLNQLQFDVLNSNAFYVNVHSVANPGGEIRGQINAAPIVGLSAVLNGDAETPPITTTATGRGSIVLDPTQMSLNYTLSAQDIVSVTAAHIHRGPVGIGGPVVAPLPGAAVLSSGGVLSGTLPTTPEMLNDLMCGNLYFNVHTTDRPAGEIRGQIVQFKKSYLPVMARQ